MPGNTDLRASSSRSKTVCSHAFVQVQYDLEKVYFKLFQVWRWSGEYWASSNCTLESGSFSHILLVACLAHQTQVRHRNLFQCFLDWNGEDLTDGTRDSFFSLIRHDRDQVPPLPLSWATLSISVKRSYSWKPGRYKMLEFETSEYTTVTGVWWRVDCTWSHRSSSSIFEMGHPDLREIQDDILMTQRPWLGNQLRVILLVL